MTLGKSFIDTFSNNMRQEKEPMQQPILSDKMGINKKKSTALQQQIVGNISGGSVNGLVQ